MITVNSLRGHRRQRQRCHFWLPTVLAVVTSVSGNFGYCQTNRTGSSDDTEGIFSRSVKQLKDSDPEKRAEAMEMVGLSSGRHPEAVAAAVALLRDPDARVRRNAATAFGAFAVGRDATRRAAEKSKPALIAATRDRDSKVREEALYCLCLLGGSSNSEALAMAACLADRDPGVRKAAAAALGHLGHLGVDASAAIPALEAAVGDSGSVRARGCLDGARPSRLKAAFDGRRAVRTVAKGRTQMAGYGFTPALSLGMIGPEAKSAAQALRSQ